MKKLYRFILFILLTMSMNHIAVAGKFRKPGEEMEGVWRITAYDVSEYPEYFRHEAFDYVIDDNFFSLPIGQLIEINYDGIYMTSGQVRGGTMKNPHVNAPHFIFNASGPISNEVCQYKSYDYMCEENKLSEKFKVTELSQNFALFVQRPDAGNKKFSGAPPYQYFLWGAQARLFVRMLNKNKLVVINESLPVPPENKNLGWIYSVWERVPNVKGR
jgi:hypothetical protein